MDPDYAFQPAYIWKVTTFDGLLPVTNFTEEVKENSKSNNKKGQKAANNKEQIGQITNFQDDEENEEGEEVSDLGRMQKSLINGSYVYLAKRGRFALIRTKKTESSLLVKLRKAP